MTIERAGTLAMQLSGLKKISVGRAISEIISRHRNELPDSDTLQQDIGAHLQSRRSRRPKSAKPKPVRPSRKELRTGFEIPSSLFPGFNPAPTALGRR
ncbi:MAG: hypothetical protein K0S38_130 [Candidatus Paceibacter sp.]|jgi:hypothetical protein|nr:hypothetical protein [Candidatus Paceibacter sp.]